MAEESMNPVNEKPAGSSKLLLISLLATLVICGGVGAAVYFLIHAEQEAELVAGADGESTPKKSDQPPIYYPIQEPFIVNLAEQPTRFLQVGVELMARDEKVINALDRHMPVIRNNLLILFSTQTLEEISTREGKEALRQQAIEEVREVLSEQSEPSSVENILFTSLVVQ